MSVDVASSLSPSAVVFSLDGQPVARIEHPPWHARVDFGAQLRPHRIAAQALDAQGKPLAVASRVVNLPASAARIDILIRRNALGAPIAVRLVSTSVRKARPVRQTLTLDGRPIAVDADGEASLPALDLRQAHVLSASAEFDTDVVARADVALGGGIADDAGSRLTALPIRVARGIEPTAGSLEGRFLAAGQALRIVTVERGSASVLLVREPDSRPAEHMIGRNTPGTGVRLEATDRVGLVWPLSHEATIGEQQTQLLESTPLFTGKEGGLLWVLTRVSRQKRSTPPYRFADAVAVAGVEAYRSGTRRAVVLAGIFGADASALSAAQVRGYLEILGVPLHVWSFGANESSWGSVQPLTSFVTYQRAATALKEDLNAQRVVWVAGEWLPGQIELAPGNDPIALVR